MKTNNLEIQRVIQRCGCDKVLPLCLVYIFYIILHGHLSPGGGFQGGILMVAATVLIYLGYGYRTATHFLVPRTMYRIEGTALVIHIIHAFVGVCLAASFCANFEYMHGNIGDLYSSGSIFWMNATVGLDVFTGAIVLSLGIISVLLAKDIDEQD